MREFGLTLSAAVVVSIGLSLTLTPMLAGQFLKQPKPASNVFIKSLERGFNWIETHYVSALDVVLRHTRLTLAVFIMTVLLAIGLYAVVPTGFFPQQDTGFLQRRLRDRARRVFRQDAARRRRTWPGSCNRPGHRGLWRCSSAVSGVNQGNLFISLKPKD